MTGYCMDCKHAHLRGHYDLDFHGSRFAPWECCIEDSVRYKKPDDSCEHFEEKGAEINGGH